MSHGGVPPVRRDGSETDEKKKTPNVVRLRAALLDTDEATPPPL